MKKIFNLSRCTREKKQPDRELTAYLVYNGKEYSCSHCGTRYLTSVGVNYCCHCGAAFISTTSYRFLGKSDKKQYEKPCVKIFITEDADNEC